MPEQQQQKNWKKTLSLSSQNLRARRNRRRQDPRNKTTTLKAHWGADLGLWFLLFSVCFRSFNDKPFYFGAQVPKVISSIDDSLSPPDSNHFPRWIISGPRERTEWPTIPCFSAVMSSGAFCPKNPSGHHFAIGSTSLAVVWMAGILCLHYEQAFSNGGSGRTGDRHFPASSLRLIRLLGEDVVADFKRTPWNVVKGSNVFRASVGCWKAVPQICNFLQRRSHALKFDDAMEIYSKRLKSSRSFVLFKLLNVIQGQQPEYVR